MPLEILPKAQDIQEAPYTLRSIKAPVLTGWILWLFVRLAESPLFFLLVKVLQKSSGLPQVLSDLIIPEQPTLFPNKAFDEPLEVPHSDVDISYRGPQECAQAAAASNAGTCRKSARGHAWTVTDYHDAYKSSKTDPVAVARKLVENVAASERLSPPMRMLYAHDPNDVLRQAQQSAERWAAGRPLSILDGVPFAVKDGINACSYPTTVGTAWVAQGKGAEKDAPMVAAVRAAGAVLIGKAGMHEIGLGITGLNTIHGTPRNPFNPQHHTGGSSSGSAALVASGICPIAIGTDGGGSIRIPSSFCGCVGLKETLGRDAPAAGPLSGVTYTVTSAGPITTCVVDAAILYAVMANAGVDVDKPCVGPVAIPKQLLPNPAASGGAALEGKRVGWYKQWFQHADTAVVEACTAALHLLEKLGAEIVPVMVPELEMVRVAHLAIISSEMLSCTALGSRSATARSQMGNDVRIALATASYFTSGDYLQALKIRTRAIAHMKDLMKQVDFLAAPSVPVTAPAIRPETLSNGESNLPLTGLVMRFVQLANLTGQPAITLPVGQDASGLPIGMQLMGCPWGEAGLLRAAAALESILPPLSKPSVSFSNLDS
ncbi:hypothetical protein WJX84_003170 [Apatococcus fuscideae]|uniref:Amidase domain-containing protein n=1 Tax=Apatococcus fuscideae TaxID=2026836 RepID=A0AAW1SQ57_9CHLO